MAKKEAVLILKIKETASKTMKGVSSVFSRFVITAGDVVNGIKAIGRATLDLALNAAKFQDVSIAFKNLANSQGQDAGAMLKNMKELSAGTISELDLMKEANNALLLGLPVERFGDMLKIARSSAKATGQSMQFMLQSITTGLGRGSKLMLDNLGILIDQGKAQAAYAQKLGITAAALTETQRKQAFINEALRIGLENTEKSGGGADTLTDSWARMNAGISDLAIKIGTVFVPAFKAIVDVVSDAITFTNELFSENKNIEDMSGKIEELKNKQKGLRDELEKAAFLSASQRQSREDAIFLIGKEIEATEKLRDAEKQRLADIKAAGDEEVANKAAVKELNRIQDEADKELAKERETVFRQAMKDIALSEEFLRVEGEILAAETLSQAKDLIAKRDLLKEQIIADQRKKNKDKEAEEDKKRALLLLEEEARIQKQKESDQRMAFSRIASLSQSHNKGLAAIGKAAAITQIAIDTPVAVAKTLAAFPAPFNFALAGAVAAAAGVQAARVAGVQLADGGIVSARQGGTQAILGEGGQDEAVVPLDDAGGGIGTTINITVNGGMLGDESSAREFAVEVDKQLLSLRQDNSSVAFDTDVI